ncbi:MAG: hypothetical protein QNL92_11235 [Octadecabacter sp.]
MAASKPPITSTRTAPRPTMQAPKTHKSTNLDKPVVFTDFASI